MVGDVSKGGEVKKPTVKAEKLKANKAFSDYIRERDRWTCYTCGRVVDKYHADAGHLFSRYFAGTLYDEDNVHCQCKKCNMLHEVDSEPYKLKFIAEYGEDFYWELYRKSKGLTQRKVYDYIELRKEFEAKLKTLKAE